MTSNEIRLKQVLANVFGEDSESINDESSMDTIENWDSLRHLNLILALEEEFEVSFDEEETVIIVSYLLIKTVLKEHNIVF
jgi:acyl carrier protein